MKRKRKKQPEGFGRKDDDLKVIFESNTKQTPLLMFTDRHRKGDSWRVGDTLYCPDKENKQNREL